MITIIIIYFLLLFYPRKQIEIDFFPKNLSIFLKGILPLFILIHHIGLNSGSFKDFNLVGEYCVGLFFFISGYGLEYIRNGHKNKLLYLFQRLKKLFIPLIIPSLIYIGLLVYIGNFCFKELLEYKIVLPYTWFIVSLSIMYIFYYLITSCVRKKIVVCICMTLVIISSTVIMAKLGLSSTYRVSNLAFLAGIYTYNMKMYISLLLAKPDIIFWNSLAFLFFVFLALLNIKGSAYLLIPIWCFCLLLGLSIMMPESKNDVAYFFLR